MSGFSDAQLVRLKNGLAVFPATVTQDIGLNKDQFEALLTRLEAAENVAKMCFECMYEDERPLPGSILDQAHKEWLLSKGGAGK